MCSTEPGVAAPKRIVPGRCFAVLTMSVSVFHGESVFT